MCADVAAGAHDRDWLIEEQQQALDAWVVEYNTQRPHQSLGMRPPVERFGLVTTPAPVTTVVPAARIGTPDGGLEHVPGSAANLWLRGVRRVVGGQGQVRLAGFTYRVPVVLAGEPVECLVAENLVQLFHRGVLVGSCPLRRKPDKDGKPRRDTPVWGSTVPAASTHSRPGAVCDERGRDSDPHGRHRWLGLFRRDQLLGRQTVVRAAGLVSVQDRQVRIEIDGQLVKTHPARHDPAKELGAFATPNGHPARRAKRAQQEAQSQHRAV